METLLSNRSRLISALDMASVKIIDYHYQTEVDIKIVNLIKDNSLEDYLSASSDPEYIEYSKDKDPSSHRISSSLARYCRRQLKIRNLPDCVLNKFCNDVKLELCSVDYINKDITLLSGKDILNFYKDLGKCHTLKSCMTGPDYYKTELYSLNPDKVNLVNYDNKARALLWTSDNGMKILDRVYPTDGSFHSALLQKWAKEKGYLQNNFLDKELFITLNHNKVFPFLDTFYHGKMKRKKIILSNKQFPKQNCILRETNGNCILSNKCSFCKKLDVDDEFIFISGHKHVCQSCIREHFIKCYHCILYHLKKDIIKISKYIEVCKGCFPYYCEKCTNCKKALVKDYYKITIDGFEKHLCEDCSSNYYTCYHCKDQFDQLKHPKTIKRGIFLCQNCK